MQTVTSKKQYQAAEYTGEQDADRETLIEWGIDVTTFMSSPLWVVRDPNMGNIVAIVGPDDYANQYVEVPSS